MMKLLKMKSRSLLSLLALVFVAGQMVACSSSKPKPDEGVKEVKKDRLEEMSEETGMSVETLETFQEALKELQTDKPDNDKVVALLEQVVEQEPNFAEAHYNLGVVYSNRMRYEDAVEHLETARDIEPEELNHTVALAQAYAVTEQYGRALTLFEEVVARQPNNLTAKNNLAVLALKEGDDEKALKFVREVLREDYENVGAFNTLGLIQKKRENMSLAKFAFGEALELSKDDPDPDVHNNLGLVFMMEDDIPKAVTQFEKANEADPNYLESRLNLGAILIEFLDYERASGQFSEAVRIAPGHCTARLGKAAADFGLGAYDSSQEAYAQSAENFEKYIAECDAEHISSHERLAELYQSKLDDPEKAIAYYEKLTEMVDDEDKKAQYSSMANFLSSQLESAKQKEPEEQADDQVEEAPEESAEESAEESEEESEEDVQESETDDEDDAETAEAEETGDEQ